MMFLNTHTHHLSHQSDVLELYNQFPNELNLNAKIYSIGIHPAYINSTTIDEETHLINHHILDKNCLAIGEIGLDKLCETDFNLQIEVFEKQIKIAEENNVTDNAIRKWCIGYNLPSKKKDINSYSDEEWEKI